MAIMNKIRTEIMDDHVNHFKSNVYTSIKMLCPFMEREELTNFINDIISKIYA